MARTRWKWSVICLCRRLRRFADSVVYQLTRLSNMHRRTILCVHHSCIRYARTYCYAIYRSNLLWSFVRHDAFDKFFGESLTQYRNGFLAFYIIEYSKFELKNEKKKFASYIFWFIRFNFYLIAGSVRSFVISVYVWLRLCGLLSGAVSIRLCRFRAIACESIKNRKDKGWRIGSIKSAERTNSHSETWNQWFTFKWHKVRGPCALNLCFDNGSFLPHHRNQPFSMSWWRSILQSACWS